jgi:hypothetical protein
VPGEDDTGAATLTKVPDPVGPVPAGVPLDPLVPPVVDPVVPVVEDDDVTLVAVGGVP